MNLVEFCRKLTAIDSSISHGTSAIVEFIAEQARQWAFSVDIQSENFNGIKNANILLSPPNASAAKKLLLISRLDTPDPGEYGHWVRTGANPFNASVDGDEIYGLGVADAKADFACKLLALREFKDKKHAEIAPVVVGTFGQSSGAGAIRLIRKKNLHAAAVLVGAPTQMLLANKGPGFAKVEISVPFSREEQDYHKKHNLSEGSVSQSKIFSRPLDKKMAPDFFDNPILKMIDYLKQLPSGISVISIEGGVSGETDPDSAYLEIDIVDTIQEGIIGKLVHIGEALKQLSAELKGVRDEICTPQFSTMTIGMIRTFPEEVKILGTCRLVPAQGRDMYERWFEGLRQSCAATGATFRILDYKPPFETSRDCAFFNFLKGVSSELKLMINPAAALNCTEANVFHRMGVDSVVFGPGNLLNQTHASQEHVNAKDLEATTQFYRKVIERYCQ